jgi:adenylate cyclase
VYQSFQRHTKEDNARARELLNEALILDSKYANAIALKAVTHFQDARFGYSNSPADSFLSAFELCKEALALDDSDPDSIALWGIIEMAQGQFEQSVETGEKAISLGPNNAEVHAMYAVINQCAGNFQKSIGHFNKAKRLYPHYPAWYALNLGKAYTEMNQYDQALEAFIDCINRAPHQTWGFIGFAVVYKRLGKVEEAKNQVAKVLELNPELTLEIYAESDRFYKDPQILKNIMEDLRRAGLK